MARTCCICGAKISMMGGCTIVLPKPYFGQDGCDECYKAYQAVRQSGTVEACNSAAEALRARYSGLTEKDVRRAVEQAITNKLDSFVIKEKEARESAAVEERRQNMMMSTCPSIDGYTATEQYGLVFGECVFKASFASSLGASVDNIIDSMSWDDRELSGSGELLNKAREYAISKIVAQAAKRGANAIIGIDSESSMGGSVMHVTIYGTAVKLEKNN